MTRFSRAICLAVLPMLLQGCASSEDRLNREISRSVATLERQQDADSLAAAALLSGNDIFGTGHRDQKHAASLIARATSAAPDRPDLAWLQATLCEQTPSCGALPFEVRVRELDPTNGVGWLGELARSWAANDEAGTNKALQAVAQSDRVDIYYTRLIATLTPKVAEAGSSRWTRRVWRWLGPWLWGLSRLTRQRRRPVKGTASTRLRWSLSAEGWRGRSRMATHS